MLNLENILNNKELYQKGVKIYNKIRNKLYVWGKTCQYLVNKKHFFVKSIVITFNDINSFLQFYSEEKGLSKFLEKLKKNILYEAKKLQIKNPKFYYIAYSEFQERGILHYHILLLTNFSFYLDNLGINKCFSKTFDYGYIYIKNLSKISVNYLIKQEQKNPALLAYYQQLLKEKFNISKIHFVYISNSLIKDFPQQYHKLKTIYSFPLLSKFAIYATKIKKLDKYSIQFYFKNNLNFTFHYKYQFINNIPIFKKLIIYCYYQNLQSEPIIITSLNYLYKFFNTILKYIFSNSSNIFYNIIKALNNLFPNYSIAYFPITYSPILHYSPIFSIIYTINSKNSSLSFYRRE